MTESTTESTEVEEHIEKRFPVLYILMRNDLASMNPGKAMAQASHASNAFVYNISKRGIHQVDLTLWESQTKQGFGTVLVLSVNEKQMRTIVDVTGSMGYLSKVVHDPTYPILDGEIVHYLPIDTCAYVFAPDKDDPILRAVLGNFPLHP